MRSVTTACDHALALAVVLATASCEVATGGAFASTGVTFGASVGGDSEESTTSVDEEIGKTDDGPDDMPKPGIEDDTSGVDDDASTDDGTSTSDAGTSTGESESESESESGAPAIEPWSPCLGGGCGDGMVCLAPPMQEGLCTQPCMPAGDTTSCAPAPDGLDTTCISVDGSSWCAIECSFAECPAGTDCFVVADDHSAAHICL